MEIRFQFVVILLLTFNYTLGNPMPQRLNFDNRNESLSRSRRIDSKFRGQTGRKPIITIAGAQECGDTYCTADPNYPSDIIASLELHKYEYLFGDDFIDTLALRFDSDESGLCQSRRRLIHPKRGQTVQNTWLTIVNDDNKYRQGVTIEECQNAHLPCEYSQNFPLGVESKCKQQFVYRNLLAINAEGKPVMEHFQFPSCCKCMVTSSRSYNRFGGGDNINSDNERRDRLILAN